MGLFGKSEAELKQIATELEKRQTDLDNRESDLKSAQATFEHERKSLEEGQAQLQSNRETFREQTKTAQDDIASERAELEKRRIELLKLEAEAKTGFAEKQRETFKEVIEKQIAELDKRQEQLRGLEKELATKLGDFHTAEAEVAKRELSVTEREQKADAGFADKARALADEAARQHKANQTEAERLRKLGEEIAEERQAVEMAKAKLAQREQSVIAAEQERDAGFADERAEQDIQMRDRRTKIEAEIAEVREKAIADLEDEIAKRRKQRLEEVTEAEQVERERVRAEVTEERQAWSKQHETTRKQLETERSEVEKQKGAVSALQSELEGRKIELERSERMLERREERLERQWEKKNDELDDKIETLLEEERASLESERQSLKDENGRLRDSLRLQTKLVGAFDQLKRQLGEKDPAEILRELTSKTDELTRLREELATRPTEEMRQKYQEMESEAQRHRSRIEELEKQADADATTVAETADLRRKNSELAADNKSLKQKAAIFEGDAVEAHTELKRLRAAYGREEERDARIRDFEARPAITKLPPHSTEKSIDEIDWLESIDDRCIDYGFKFHPRILRAFHTALKTAEWAPLTILAGVSGTGKSKLPELYAHFGGMPFLQVPVQPNWDSQESMLGFYNSIDDRFDAQPLLRFLAQTQKKAEDGYPGALDAVCMVLLDEMNLAHAELYFASFLSKLEQRRGRKGANVPALEVKLGTGFEHPLALGRNVLWTGTMNQDETTKSLSDKVLDRSIVIHFPRPTSLERRKELKPLPEAEELLPRKTWEGWWSRQTGFTDEEVQPFKLFIEDMNESLAQIGRALGHRVWQSIEYYMANYPTVRAARNGGDAQAVKQAMREAFEDQLVQKVMPKLRGIDTRSTSGKRCLNSIHDQLVEHCQIRGVREEHSLLQDFEIARGDMGYGQFIWQSAEYLQDSGIGITPRDTAEGDEAGGEMQSEAPQELTSPPGSYHPDDPERDEKWSKLTAVQKRMFAKE